MGAVQEKRFLFAFLLIHFSISFFYCHFLSYLSLFPLSVALSLSLFHSPRFCLSKQCLPFINVPIIVLTPFLQYHFVYIQYSRNHRHMKIGAIGDYRICSKCSKSFHRVSRPHRCSLLIWCRCSRVSIPYHRVQINVATRSTWRWRLWSTVPRTAKEPNITVCAATTWKDFKRMRMCTCLCESKWIRIYFPCKKNRFQVQK